MALNSLACLPKLQFLTFKIEFGCLKVSTFAHPQEKLDKHDLRDSANRDALHDIEIAHKCAEGLAVPDAAVGGVAVVHAAALADLLVVLVLTGLHDKPDVHDLCLAYLPVPDAIQRTAAAFAVGWLVLYNPIRRGDGLKGVPLVSGLTAAWPPTGLAQGFCPAQLAGRNAFLRRRDAAVAAVLLGLPRCCGGTSIFSQPPSQLLDACFGRTEFHLQAIWLRHRETGTHASLPSHRLCYHRFILQMILTLFPAPSAFQHQRDILRCHAEIPS